MFVSHYLFFVLFLSIFSGFLTPLEFLLALFAGWIFSGIPDLDSKNSKFSRKFGLFSRILRHRKQFHSIFFIFVLSVIFSYLLSFIYNKFLFWFSVFFFSGFLHLITDSLCGKTAFFWPIYKKNIGISVFKTGSKYEFLFIAGLLIFSIIHLFLSKKFLELFFLLLITASNRKEIRYVFFQKTHKE